jgi:diacylglycerol kinase family enzyme
VHQCAHRITLVHNPAAGYHNIKSEDIVAMLSRACYAPQSVSSKDPELDRSLEDPGDFVVVAGGDGTVATIAIKLAGKGVPVFVLPLGTANNIATSLGIVGSVNSLVPRIRDAKPQRVDIGVARGRWGEKRFVESVGTGLIAATIRNIEPLHDQSHPRFATPSEEFQHAYREMIKVLERTAARQCALQIDGIDRSGKYALVEAMNITCIGPNLCLASHADAGDGLLDLVLVAEHDRGRLCDYLNRRIEGDVPDFPFPTIRANDVVIDPCSAPLHIDDELHSESHEPLEPPGPIRLCIEAPGVAFLIP